MVTFGRPGMYQSPEVFVTGGVWSAENSGSILRNTVYPVFSPDAPGAFGGTTLCGRGASREGGISRRGHLGPIVE